MLTTSHSKADIFARKLQAPIKPCYIPNRVIDIYLGVAMNIRELLVQARHGAGVNSNRQLAFKLGIANSHLGKYEQSAYLPGDEILCNICELANANPAEWLLWARMQREEGKARQYWEEIKAAYVKRRPAQVA